MGDKILFTALALVCLIVSISIVSAGEEIQLTYGQRLTQCLRFHGNWVTWAESAGNGVHIYDLTAGKEIDVPGVNGDNINVYGNKAVWYDWNYDGVLMYDISTGEKINVNINGYYPDIYENYVVYDSEYSHDVYLYNLNTSKGIPIASYLSGYSFSSPVIYGNKVVWMKSIQNDDDTYTRDVYLYTIPTRQTSKISTSGTAGNPDIYENIVVWSDTNNGKTDIFMCDTETQKKTQVTTSGTASEPAIYGNRIVYTNWYSSGGSDIYMYEISSAKAIRITTSKWASCPAIYGNKIVYLDSRNDQVYHDEVKDVYLYDLSTQPT